MPARLRKMHQDDVRAKIKTSQLINRLTDHALADEPILEASQVNAIKILLGKTLPDLQSIEHSGEVATGPVYDLSLISDTKLLELEGLLESARSAGDDTGGAIAAKPSQVH